MNQERTKNIISNFLKHAKEVSVPSISHAPNKKLIEFITKSYENPERNKIKCILNAITYISFVEFSETLAICVKSFESGMHDKVYTLGLFSNTGGVMDSDVELDKTIGYNNIHLNKSSLWVSYQVFNLFDTKPSLDQDFRKIRDLVICDDVAYTGRQIESTISWYIKILKSCGNSNVQLHVIIPYISKYAYEYLILLINQQNIVKVTIYFHQNLNDIDTLIKNEASRNGLKVTFEDLKQTFLCIFRNTGHDTQGYYFQHKFPDGRSFVGHYFSPHSVWNGGDIGDRYLVFKKYKYIQNRKTPQLDNFVQFLVDNHTILTFEEFKMVVAGTEWFGVSDIFGCIDPFI